MIEYDIIGTLKDPAAYEYDAEGNVIGTITPEVIHDGWHVNVYEADRAERPDLEPFVVVPGHLRQEFMGRREDTVALVFADEAEAESFGFVAATLDN